MSGFAGIHKLPPAHLATVERGKPIALSRYYALPQPSHGKVRPVAELEEELVGELQAATRLRMISDVPLGAFLSGGVDSSSVVAMMARVSKDRVRTFTIGFEEQTYDERPYARMVAERYETQHQDDGPPGCHEHPAGAHLPFRGTLRRQFRHPDILCVEDDHPISLDRYQSTRRVRQAAGRLYGRRSRRYEQFIACFSDAAKAELYAGDMRRRLERSALDRLDHYFDQARTMAEGAASADITPICPTT